MKKEDSKETIVRLGLWFGSRSKKWKPKLQWPKLKDEEAELLRKSKKEIRGTMGLGIVTGVSGLLVLDLDRKNGKDGVKVLGRWLRAKGYNGKVEMKKAGVIATSKKGGYHLYFLMPLSLPEGLPTTTTHESGIDTRGVGGMIVCPPTPGYSYIKEEWENLVDAPAWVIDWLLKVAAEKGVPGATTGKSAVKGSGLRIALQTHSAPDRVELTACDGRTGTASELVEGQGQVSVYCPFHDDLRRGGSPSATLFWNDGWPRLNCFRCGVHDMFRRRRQPRKRRKKDVSFEGVEFMK